MTHNESIKLYNNRCVAIDLFCTQIAFKVMLILIQYIIIEIMGKCFSKEESEEDIVQPKFLGDLPEPYPIQQIEPELMVYRKNRTKSEFKFDVSPEDVVDLMIQNDLLAKSRCVFLTHGFRSDKHKEWLHLMKDRMIEERDQTVVIVGWGQGADIGIFYYEQASANALAVGQWLSSYLVEIYRRFPETILWGLGHSLGAHLMGVTGRECGVMHRITGLDPAGVGFQVENHDKRLSKRDAKLVDVIHSDGKSVPYFGTLMPLGSLDFYPNFGWSQPTNDTSDDKPYMVSDKSHPKGPVSPYGSGFTISHTRAIDYFIWSIDNRNRFVTKIILEDTPDVEVAVHRIKCVPHEAEMGYFADEHLIEVAHHSLCYYIATNASEPWA